MDLMGFKGKPFWKQDHDCHNWRDSYPKWIIRWVIEISERDLIRGTGICGELLPSCDFEPIIDLKRKLGMSGLV